MKLLINILLIVIIAVGCNNSKRVVPEQIFGTDSCLQVKNDSVIFFYKIFRLDSVTSFVIKETILSDSINEVSIPSLGFPVVVKEEFFIEHNGRKEQINLPIKQVDVTNHQGRIIKIPASLVDIINIKTINKGFLIFLSGEGLYNRSPTFEAWITDKGEIIFFEYREYGMDADYGTFVKKREVLGNKDSLEVFLRQLNLSKDDFYKQNYYNIAIGNIYNKRNEINQCP